MVVHEDDQVMAIMKSGKVIRSDVSEIKRTGRNTQGVTLAKTGKDDEILSIARNAEKDDETGDGQNTEDSVNNSDAADRDGSTRSTVEQGITTDSAAGTSSAE